VVIITSGCSSPTYSKLNYSYNGAIENARIDNKEFAAKINNQIAEIYGSQAAVDVISDHFNILVVGQVESDGVADGIKFLIKSYPVVKSYISYATISSPPVLLTQEQVNKKVLDRIAAEDNLNQDNIQAVTIAGTVYIIGQISKYEAPNLKSIEEGLYSIPGVYKVNNLIKVMPYTNTL
ncbi:MAG: BON domain-containing protein, partial [Burkholderiales bacterium]|nr:BON domain-containing protein [Burkholderiales bacterium]